MTRPAIVFYALPWLMVLLIVGTISQRYIGLYESERLFFSSWFVWVGIAPLPGTYLTLAILTSALLAKITFKSPWTAARAGTITTHLGALLLLLGGMLTALTSEEGYISFAEGDSISSVSDYHMRELAILKNDELIHHIPAEELRDELQVEHPDIPFNIVVDYYCRNCLPFAPEGVADEVRGLARKVMIKRTDPEKEDEANQSGVMFTLNGVDEQQDGVYMGFEPTPHQPSVMVGDDEYHIMMRKEQRPLPFTVTLEEFDRFVHPGTDMAREYQSLVSITEAEGLSWQRLIRMNEPLRVQGYTLYQSSFLEANGKTISVLAVVKNHGRVFPYIASFVIGIGLIMHAVLRVRHRKAAHV